MKKLTVLFLLLAMCVAMFAGCGGEKTPAPVDPVDPAPVDPVDPAPVDPAPVDPAPVDPAPVDPAPVDPAPVDPAPVDPAPVDPVEPEPSPAPVPQDVTETYWTAVSYAEIYEAIGSIAPKTVNVSVDGYKKTNLAKEAAAGIKADAGDAGKKTVGGVGSQTTVTYEAATGKLSISTFVTYMGAVKEAVASDEGYVSKIEKRDTTQWGQYLDNVLVSKSLQGYIVCFQMDQGTVKNVEGALGQKGTLSDFTKDENGNITTITFEGTVYDVNCNAWAFGVALKDHLTEDKKNTTHKVWFDYEGNILYISNQYL